MTMILQYAILCTRENLKVPTGPFPSENKPLLNTADSCKSFPLSLSQKFTECENELRQTNLVSVLGIHHTKIYGVNLVGFKHKAFKESLWLRQKPVHFEIVKILKCTLKTTMEGFLHLGIIKIPNQP